ncbi:hypothetical protein NDI85_06380 [Halomicroarcula sp. S1AR25-4]|uniref:hypothetical protein n=1 Tax=Haloarcula sp. S1AR25-4 TaxID=2950538 RepID=UPI002874B649|nr:hypothetical protein [Halomicroarcula sp. S1AR25-4]MDS0277413.1 hypothetical protein [Halomicroarcula sp. S1AR25-4]
MERNVGGYDRIGRLLFGPVSLVVGAAIRLGVVSLDAGRLAIVAGSSPPLSGPSSSPQRDYAGVR